MQSFPTFAAFLIKLCGNHDLSGDPGVAIASLQLVTILLLLSVTTASVG